MLKKIILVSKYLLIDISEVKIIKEEAKKAPVKKGIVVK